MVAISSCDRVYHFFSCYFYMLIVSLSWNTRWSLCVSQSSSDPYSLISVKRFPSALASSQLIWTILNLSIFCDIRQIRNMSSLFNLSKLEDVEMVCLLGKLIIVLLKCFTLEAVTYFSFHSHRKNNLKSPASPSLSALNNFDDMQLSLCISVLQTGPPPTSVSNIDSSCSCCHVFTVANHFSSQSNIVVLASEKQTQESVEKLGCNKWEKKKSVISKLCPTFAFSE